MKNRIESMRIKKHVFVPSGRKLYTVIGNDEYYISNNREFCFCIGFMMSKTHKCCHLDALYHKDAEKRTDTTLFYDSEYEEFVTGLFNDMFAKLRLIKGNARRKTINSQGF